MRMLVGPVSVRSLLPAIALAAVLSTLSQSAAAQRTDRQGKEVVDAVCGACHATGKDGAPRIGDAKAWEKRASQGLTSLTNNAIRGIRKMPAHGGNKGVSDVEIERAIVYMVNQSGGNWVEPVGGATPACARNAPSATRPDATARRESATGPRGPPGWPRGWTRRWPRLFTATGRCRPAADCRT